MRINLFVPCKNRTRLRPCLHGKWQENFRERARRKPFKGRANKEPNCDFDTVREQGHRETDIEKVHEKHLKEDHEVKMRILKKKEQLLDLKL